MVLWVERLMFEQIHVGLYKCCLLRHFLRRLGSASSLGETYEGLARWTR